MEEGSDNDDDENGEDQDAGRIPLTSKMVAKWSAKLLVIASSSPFFCE